MKNIKPDFINDKSLQEKESIEFFNGNLEEKILSIGLSVASHGRIDWNNINCLKLTEEAAFPESIINFLSSKSESTKCLVYWSNALKYCIEVDVKFLSIYIQEIIEEDWDFWIAPTDESWLLEYYHEGELVIFEKERTK